MFVDDAVTHVLTFPAESSASATYTPHVNIPRRLATSISRAKASLKQGDYEGALNAARRSVEAVFKIAVDPLPAGKKRETLHALIERSVQQLDLSKPLKDLAHAVREGGNLGSHFDENVEPNASVAFQAVELAERLSDFIFVLPKEIDELRMSLAEVATGDESKELAKD